MTEIERAEQTLAALQDKRAKWIARGTELADERTSVAFNAHTGTDPKVRQKLDSLHAQIGKHESELLSIDAAIAEAETRLAVAQRSAAIAADKEQAGRLLEELECFEACARALDENLKAVIRNAHTMEECLIEMNRLGCANPSRAQFDTFGSIAVTTALMSTPWARSFQRLAPNQRQSFSNLVENWSRIIRSNAQQRLGGETPQKRRAA
jgi:hypothetical protein